MSPSFLSCWNTLLKNEGGYANLPGDSGHETMYGITSAVAKAYGYMGDMRKLPLETAQQIAYKVYWLPLKLDSFDPRVAFQILDTNYNGGKCVLWMQGASGAKVDGVLGPQTIAAVQSTDPLKFILRWNSLRIRYYTSLAKWVNFGKGWANRVAGNLWKGGE